MVVVNPDSGPGESSPYPNNDYSAQIQKLNAFPNVKTIGYVRTGFATRNITAILQDVSTYSGWSKNPNAANSTAMHGIFFDEVPNEWSAETAQYLNTINQAVKNAPGLLPDRTVSAVQLIKNTISECLTLRAARGFSTVQLH
jgi:hypothetical protein